MKFFTIASMTAALFLAGLMRVYGQNDHERDHRGGQQTQADHPQHDQNRSETKAPPTVSPQNQRQSRGSHAEHAAPQREGVRRQEHQHEQTGRTIPENQAQPHAQQLRQEPAQMRGNDRDRENAQHPPQRGSEPQTARGQIHERANQAHPARTPRQARAWQDREGWLQGDTWRGRNTWEQNRAQHWASEHRTWAQRGGYGGYYIPTKSFASEFGTRHTFRLLQRPVIYRGFPAFVVNGYTFLIVDPWPEYWPLDWYDADNLYIIYDNGYYLCNLRYPGVRLALAVMIGIPIG
jgi:hypothetical protein